MEKYSSCNILVFGLPGSGKSSSAKKLAEDKLANFNANEIRKIYNDWDFTEEGRTRQAERMFALTGLAKGHCVVDFVCPYDEYRVDYNITVWMNTIKEGRFEDTNKLFQKPIKVDYEITNYNYNNIIKEIRDKLQ